MAYLLVNIPMLTLLEENCPIGRWGRIHQKYLKESCPGYYSGLLLTGKLWTYLADLDEQAQERLDRIAEQMQVAESVAEELKANDQLEWVRRCNSIRNRAEEIVRAELIDI